MREKAEAQKICVHFAVSSHCGQEVGWCADDRHDNLQITLVAMVDYPVAISNQRTGDDFENMLYAFSLSESIK
jgi:hypothetical protein